MADTTILDHPPFYTLVFTSPAGSAEVTTADLSELSDRNQAILQALLHLAVSRLAVAVTKAAFARQAQAGVAEDGAR